jgi:hypothetical protein
VAGCSGQPNDFDFVASSTNITSGQSVTLSWNAVNNASAAFLIGGEFGPDPGQGVAAPGNRVVSPAATTEYKLKAICNNSGLTREKTVTVNVSAPVGNFAGAWYHNFGKMNLTQVGNNVTGTYANGFSGGNGSIAGIVEGNTLTGTYTIGGSGPIEFTLSADGKRFDGTWGASNKWCGARDGEFFPNGCSYQGNFTSDYGDGNCPMTLQRKDNNVTGSYCIGNVTGTISFDGNFTVLTGTYNNLIPGSGPFKFFLAGYNGLRFQGNYNNGGGEWCGWRASSSKPSPCEKN